jgi:peptidoglycan L-alanyl-D-glutamate endopeptidase CwlK
VSALLLTRVDTTLAYPPFMRRFEALLDDAMTQSRAYWCVELHRTYARSDTLFAQGRTTPGPIVTNARAGQSAHNFGIAGDLVLDGYMDRAGLQPDYRPASYDLLGILAPKHGLVWGGSWHFKDLPHVQAPQFITAADMEPLRQAFAAGGLPAVWAYLDQHLVFPTPA